MTSISDTNVVNAPGGLVELGYLSYGSGNVALTGSNNTYIGGTLTVVCDGSPVIAEIYFPRVDMAGSSDSWIVIEVDGVSQGRVLTGYNPNTGGVPSPTHAAIRLTPSAGAHTFRMRAYSSTGTTTWLTGGGVFPDGYLRVSKIIQASQLIVQTPNAPLVTSLPSNAIDGQEVRYLADNTNGIIWNFRYRAGSSSTYKWEFIGGSPLFAFETASVSTTSGSFTSIAGDNLSVPIPLAGDYDVEVHALGSNSAGAFYWWLICPSGCSYPTSDQRGIRVGSQSAGAYTTGSHRSRVPLTVGTLTAQYRQAAGGTMTVAERSFTVTPIRVSA